MVDDISAKCDICKQFKPTPPRPVVSFPLASSFNETVAMDLKVMGERYILHMIDHATRFSAAAVISSKRKETIVKGVLEYWVRIFGTPKYFLTDNGGEFVNSELIDFSEKFNITLKTTAAESAWSNGLCEKHNGILGDMIDKTTLDTGCTLDEAVHWSVAAKNSLLNIYGYSPNQLVFGRNPNLPSVHSDRPPAENSSCDVSKYISQNLRAIHSARQAFIQQESCEKLRRALSRKTRIITIFTIGESVYYKRNDSRRWHGPAKVLGKDGKNYLLKHGGIYIRVHPTRMQLIESENNSQEVNTAQNETNEPSTQVTPNQNTEVDSDSDSENQERSNPGPHIPPTHDDRQSPEIPSTVTPPNMDNRQPAAQSRIPLAVRRLQAFNKSPESSVTTEEILFSSEAKRFDEAKLEELQKWIEMDTYEEVDDTGQEPRISCRWVLTEKEKAGQIIKKARLVARGFEEQNPQLSTDSPTCAKESLRLLLLILASYYWRLHSLDVKSAYLQGMPINRTLYLIPPRIAHTERLWKLKKCPYGINDAGRHWYLRVLDELKSLGGYRSKVDQAMFVWKENNSLIGIMIIHVDDFLCGGTEQFHRNVLGPLRISLTIGSEESSGMKYLGLFIEESDDSIYFHSNDYARSLEEIPTINLGEKDRELNPVEKTKLRQVSGQLNWLATQSRPDLSYDNCILGTSISRATVQDVYRANKALRKAKGQWLSLRFPKGFHLPTCRIVGFCDASFANLHDRGSQGGYIIFLCDENGLYCPVMWQSHRLRRVAGSTLTAECLAAVDAAEACIYIQSVLLDILCWETSKGPQISLISDSKSLVDATHATTTVQNKRLQIDISLLREMVNNGELNEFRWITGKNQTANALTKVGTSTDYLCEILQGKMTFDKSNGIFVN